MEVYGFDLIDVLLITIPASIIGILAHGIRDESSREGARRRPRVPAAPRCGRVAPAGAARRDRAAAIREAQPRSDLPRRRRRDLRLRADYCDEEGIRPTVAAEEGGVEPMSITPLIQMFMLTAAALILLLCRVKANDVPSTLAGSFRSGMVAMIALFGIAWMADTFVDNNEDAMRSDCSAAWPRNGRS